MALYDGFFNAVYDEDTETYDRTYDAGDHVEFYSYFIGSGVCVLNNEDSFLVSYNSTTKIATVAAGYLFINGYWLKNDGDYSVQLPSSGAYAILAQLDTSNRCINVTYAETSSSYSNALCLATVNVTTATLTDTRYDVDLCGIIDSAGNLSDMVEYAVDYIDNTAEARLTAAESNVASAVSDIQSKAAEVEALAESMGYPEIGTLKYSAGSPGSKWLACNGQYVSANDYPDLVDVMGLTSLADDLTELYSGYIGGYISNGVIYDDYLYFINWASKLLIGIALDGTSSSKSISISSLLASSTRFINPTVNFPLALSIFDGYFALCQMISSTKYTLCICKFDGSAFSDILNESKLALYNNETFGHTINPVPPPYIGYFDPYSESSTSSGSETLTFFSGIYDYYPNFTDTHCEMIEIIGSPFYDDYRYYARAQMSVYSKSYTYCFSQRAVNPKNKEQQDITVTLRENTDGTYYTRAFSRSGIYDITAKTQDESLADGMTGTASFSVLPVASDDDIIFNVEITSTGIAVYSIDRGGAGVTIVNVEMSLPSAATIFTESICSNASAFFIFCGTGIIVTTDPTNADTYSYVSTVDLIGAITKFGYINYDEDNDQLVVLGITSASYTKVAIIPLADWAASDTGIYLPTLSKSGLQGYIKALEG